MPDDSYFILKDENIDVIFTERDERKIFLCLAETKKITRTLRVKRYGKNGIIKIS